MSREAYHPNAYLSRIRNTKRGLRARSSILEVVNTQTASARAFSDKTGFHYSVVNHHLKLLEREGVVHKSGKRPSLWAKTGIGQRRLTSAN